MENNNPHQLKDEARSIAGSGCYEMNIKTRPQEERHIMVIQLGNNDVLLGRGKSETAALCHTFAIVCWLTDASSIASWPS